jgi:DNA-binding GntR family transcriptional regulator
MGSVTVPNRGFPEVKATPLSEVVLRVVREAIVDGSLAPGETINQVELSRQLGVSRAPLREALRQLEKEGLVTHIPYRGTIVTPLTRRGVEELQSFRRLIEFFAAGQLMARAGAVEFDELEQIVEEMAKAVSEGDNDKLNEADIQFHSRIIELSDHQILKEVWETYVQQIRRILTFRNRYNLDLQQLVKLHRDLVAALRARDREAVRRCYDVHGADVADILSHQFGDGTPHSGCASSAKQKRDGTASD